MQRMLIAALALCLGCATTTNVHRPPTVAEGTEINYAAVVAGGLAVQYDPPADSRQPVVPLTTQIDGGYLGSAELDRLTIAAPGRPPLVLPLDRVRSVSVVHRGQGMAAGFVLGIAAAIVGGIVAGKMSNAKTDDCDSFCGPGATGFAWGILVAAITIPTGTMVGAAIGHRRTFTLGETPVAPGPSSDSWGP